MAETGQSGVDLSVDLGRLRLASPVIAASGTFGYGLEFEPFIDAKRLGGFVTKGLSLHPRIGNPAPRMVETPSGMLNAIGLENIGIERFLTEKMPLLHAWPTRIFVNFFGESLEEYAEMGRALERAGRIDGVEMNISCPNVAEGGVSFSSRAETVEQVVGAVRRVVREKFLIVKLSPNVTDITETARAAEAAGADALSVANTYVGMKMDLETRKPYLANVTGGLSGPAIRPLSLAMVYKTARAVKVPVIGIGGIVCGEDALEYLMAGAAAVQIGTANFIEPDATMRVVSGIEKFCRDRGIRSLGELRPS